MRSSGQNVVFHMMYETILITNLSEYPTFQMSVFSIFDVHISVSFRELFFHYETTECVLSDALVLNMFE